MEGFFRRPRAISDARPPAPPHPGRAGVPRTCTRCGAAVSSDQGIDRGRGLEHLVCEPAIVADLERRLEAGHALHRALATLATIAPMRPHVEAVKHDVGDVIDVAEVRAALVRLRTAVELTHFARPEQRKLALALLDGLATRTDAP
ncbi:MAG: hypothetical protein U0353_12720 [Sandaracinus sp.]